MKITRLMLGTLVAAREGAVARRGRGTASAVPEWCGGAPKAGPSRVWAWLWPRWWAAGSGAGASSVRFAEVGGLSALLGEPVAVRARPGVAAWTDHAVGPASVGLDPV